MRTETEVYSTVRNSAVQSHD